MGGASAAEGALVTEVVVAEVGEAEEALVVAEEALAGVEVEVEVEASEAEEEVEEEEVEASSPGATGAGAGEAREEISQARM